MEYASYNRNIVRKERVGLKRRGRSVSAIHRSTSPSGRRCWAVTFDTRPKTRGRNRNLQVFNAGRTRNRRRQRPRRTKVRT